MKDTPMTLVPVGGIFLEQGVPYRMCRRCGNRMAARHGRASKSGLCRDCRDVARGVHWQSTRSKAPKRAPARDMPQAPDLGERPHRRKGMARTGGLSDVDVTTIRTLYAQGTATADLAARFNRSPGYIRDIINRRKRKDVP